MKNETIMTAADQFKQLGFDSRSYVQVEASPTDQRKPVGGPSGPIRDCHRSQETHRRKNPYLFFGAQTEPEDPLTEKTNLSAYPLLFYF